MFETLFVLPLSVSLLLAPSSPLLRGQVYFFMRGISREATEWSEKAIQEDVARGQLVKGNSAWGSPAFPTAEAPEHKAIKGAYRVLKKITKTWERAEKYESQGRHSEAAEAGASSRRSRASRPCSRRAL